MKRGLITAEEEFLFPDQELGELPEQLEIVMPKNGRPGIQLLYLAQKEITLALEGQGFCAEWFQMQAVPVEYNTGSGDEQSGAMASLMEEKPDYAIRKAPFWVYDCLAPCPDGKIGADQGIAAAYFCLSASDGVAGGTYFPVLKVEEQGEVYRCVLKVRVYDVEIPEEDFGVTNWFSVASICRFHQVEPGTEEFLEMLKKYALAMRRVRQNMFYMELDETCVSGRNPWSFDFEYLKPMIETFFETGMKTLEIGPLLSRGHKEDGSLDMYTERFRCAMAPDVDLETEAGYKITTGYVKALASFLKKYGWEKKVVFHIHDEPDVHYRSEASLENRRRQYYMAAGILKKYLPDARVIEAVKTTKFRGGVDIWVPVTSSYEEEKEAFDTLTDLGEELWTYVCCVPEGNWLNRFLDQPVLHSRLLFWGCEKYRMSGFLHWGFNQFQLGMDPFQGTSCPNHTGIGTNFPCGDAFLVYPGREGPWLSLRLEAHRRGTEDLELLKKLRQSDRETHDRLMGRVFENFYTYQDDTKGFQSVYQELLEACERVG